MDLQVIFDNYKRVLTQHYFDMHGRVGRSEFWYFVLANVVASILAGLVGGMTHTPLGELYNLAVLLPSTCIAARRLQDVGKDGRLAWLLFFLAALSQILAVLTAMTWVFAGFFAFFWVPADWLIGIATLVVAVVLLYFCCQPGDPGDNPYGPPPPVFDPSRPAAGPV